MTTGQREVIVITGSISQERYGEFELRITDAAEIVEFLDMTPDQRIDLIQEMGASYISNGAEWETVSSNLDSHSIKREALDG